MHGTGRAIALVLLLGLGGCEPQDRRPGLWLAGETRAEWPGDWSFTAAHPEIFIEVATPYRLPHSVTIWCATVEGGLYVAAGRPETKRWPRWADANPAVRLKIGDALYRARLEPIAEAADIAPVAEAFAAKYARSGGSGPGEARYWRVLPPD
jgi:hypothetical protein